MLLCLTKIDDLPAVEKNFERICKLKGWKLICKNAPKLEELQEIASDVRVIFMNPNKSHIEFSSENLGKFPKLEVFCTASTGTIHIDLDAARNQGVDVISIKKFEEVLSTIPSTAELAFTLTMDGLRKVTQSHNDVMENHSWNFENFIGKQIKDLNVAVVGYGRLGKIYSKMMQDAGAEIDLLDPRLSLNFEADCNEFLSKADRYDVVALHLHAEGNEHFISDRFFNVFKKDVVLVNTSRGEIVDHDALFNFLDATPTATYCTDVVPHESLDGARNEMLRKFKSRNNILITQHIGGMSSGARQTAFGLASKLLSDHLENPLHE